MDEYKLYCLGSRGSWPVEGHTFNEFGGNTTCYVLKKDSYCLVIDAGTGLYSAKPLFVDCKKVDIIITHLHYDHILGLLDWGTLPDNSILTFYGNFDAWYKDETLAKFFDKPFWPVRPNFKLVTIPKDGETLTLNDELNIKFYSANHPNDSKEFIIEYQNHKLVAMFDNEKADSLSLDLIKDSDLLLYDGMYTDEIYPKKVGYGHSTYQEGVKLALKAKPKRLIITHHDPLNEDVVLNRLEKEARISYPDCDFARAGQEWYFPYIPNNAEGIEYKKDSKVKHFFDKIITDMMDREEGDYYSLLYINMILGALILGCLLLAFKFVTHLPIEILLAMGITDSLNAFILYKKPKWYKYIKIEYIIEKAIYFILLFLTSRYIVYGFTWLLFIPSVGLIVLGAKRARFIFYASELAVILALNTDVFKNIVKFDVPEGGRIKLPLLYLIFYLACLSVEALKNGYQDKAVKITREQEEIIQKQTQELRDQNYSLMLINSELELRNKILTKQFGEMSNKQIVDELHNENK